MSDLAIISNDPAIIEYIQYLRQENSDLDFVMNHDIVSTYEEAEKFILSVEEKNDVTKISELRIQLMAASIRLSDHKKRFNEVNAWFRHHSVDSPGITPEFYSAIRGEMRYLSVLTGLKSTLPESFKPVKPNYEYSRFADSRLYDIGLHIGLEKILSTFKLAS